MHRHGRGRLTFGDAQRLHDLLNFVMVVHKGDNSHLSSAARAFQGIYFQNAIHALRPCPGCRRDGLRRQCGYGRLGAMLFPLSPAPAGIPPIVSGYRHSWLWNPRGQQRQKLQIVEFMGHAVSGGVGDNIFIDGGSYN